jgi:hypothetical protein
MNLKWLYRLLAVWDCRPMPAELTAVWGAFLHEGLMCHPGDPGRSRRILETWDSGCIELIIASCEYLDPLWQTVSHIWFEPRGRSNNGTNNASGIPPGGQGHPFAGGARSHKVTPLAWPAGLPLFR